MSTREAIIEVATHLFAEKGYEGMTMKEIAKKVGIKAPSVYAFFESKEEVLLHVYQNTMSEHLNIAASNTEADQKSTESKLYDMLSMIMDFQLRESTQMKIFIRLLLFPPNVFDVNLKQKLVALEQQEIALFKEIFKTGMERGEIRQADSEELAMSLLCMMDGWFWQMQRYDEEMFRDRFERTWRQFWNNIKQ